jgi:hypothetical protein
MSFKAYIVNVKNVKQVKMLAAICDESCGVIDAVAKLGKENSVYKENEVVALFTVDRHFAEVEAQLWRGAKLTTIYCVEATNYKEGRKMKYLKKFYTEKTLGKAFDKTEKKKPAKKKDTKKSKNKAGKS